MKWAEKYVRKKFKMPCPICGYWFDVIITLRKDTIKLKTQKKTKKSKNQIIKKPKNLNNFLVNLFITVKIRYPLTVVNLLPMSHQLL